MAKNRKMQTPANREEAKERMTLMQTRGRKGVHLPRINMAFTPENHDFIKTMAFVTGKSMADFLNHIVTEYRKEYGQDYDAVLEMRKRIMAIKENISKETEEEQR